MSDKAKKILVIRNDKIGDFMLAWPAFRMIKHQYPDAIITALVPEYTAPLAEYCEWIDKVMIDTKKSSFFPDVFQLYHNIKNENFDVSLSLFSETRTAIALWLARIKKRIGPATKIAQLFLNYTLRQKRSQSLKPEYIYNTDLINFYIKLDGQSPVTIQPPPYLMFNKSDIETRKNQLKNKYTIPDDCKIIIIHAGTGGSAINLSPQQYAMLANEISILSSIYIILTAGPGEIAVANNISKQLDNINHHTYESKNGIIDFSQFINTCDLFISGSTGPLHIAGALNMPTCAIYPARRSATSLRWRTLNDEKKQIAVTAINDDMTTIDLKKVAGNIVNLLKNQ